MKTLALALLVAVLAMLPLTTHYLRQWGVAADVARDAVAVADYCTAAVWTRTDSIGTVASMFQAHMDSMSVEVFGE